MTGTVFPTFGGTFGWRPFAIRGTPPAIFMPLSATMAGRWRARIWFCSTRAQRKGAATGREILWGPRGFFPSARISARSRATRAFFFDDSQTPQAYGTGTEEWGGGGDYWGGRNMTLPFAGHPTGARNEKEAVSEEDKIESAYRFLLADLFPFGKNAVIRLEHGGENKSTEHYQTVTYWYGAPKATLMKTDELKIADAASEKTHEYHSAAGSEPYEINSRNEWGPDTLDGKEIYPAHIDHK